MISPFADYANATLRFPIASGTLSVDPATGNIKPAKSFLSVNAMLTQKAKSIPKEIPGVDISAVYLEGYAIEPMLLPSVVAPNSFCQATWDGKAGKFYLLLQGRSPYGVAPITGDKLKGYFQVAEFLVDGEPWIPDRLPQIESEYESVEVDVSVQIGQPLYLKPNGRADLAQANAIATCRICGLAVTAASATTATSYSLDGTVERADWTAITGTIALVPGVTYYLSPDTAGRLTVVAPEAAGQIVAIAGTAITAKKLAIEIQSPILL